MKAPQQGRGNDGAVESAENHEQVSPSSHRPLEISQGRRDSHIPTARRRPAGERGKPKSGFPHSPAKRATATASPSSEQQNQTLGRSARRTGERPASRCPSAAAFSVSSCVGNESRFQYHSSIGKCSAAGRQLRTIVSRCLRGYGSASGRSVLPFRLGWSDFPRSTHYPAARVPAVHPPPGTQHVGGTRQPGWWAEKSRSSET